MVRGKRSGPDNRIWQADLNRDKLLLPRWVTASGVAANPGRSTADERVAALSV